MKHLLQILELNMPVRKIKKRSLNGRPVRTIKKKISNPIDDNNDLVSDEVWKYLNKAGMDYEKSIEMAEAFAGLDADKTVIVNEPSLPKTGWSPGFVVGIIYAAKRDDVGDGIGEMSVYEHLFADGDAPMLVIAPNGRRAYMIGGNYQFGDRGFVDDSDVINHYDGQSHNRQQNPIKIVKRRK